MTATFRLRKTLLLTFLSVLLAPALCFAEPAPDFALRDSNETLVTLGDFAGKPLVLHFWASWCPYCKKLQPGLENLVTTYAEQDLTVLGISFREDDGVLPQAVLKQRGLSFKTLIAGDSAAKIYGVRGTPTTFFIDRKGQIVEMTNTSDPEDPVLTRLAEAIVASHE